MSAHHCERCVELLYFAGCPSYGRVWLDLFAAIEEVGVDACVRPVLVATAEEAQELGFAGSPSVRVNGVDIEGQVGSGTLSCRVYAENGGRNWPSQELLKKALALPAAG